MRMMADGFVLNSSSMGAPGVDEVKWLKPMRPGDGLTLRATVLSTRASGSRLDRGFANVLLELTNASGEKVMALDRAADVRAPYARRGRRMKFFEDYEGRRSLASSARTPSPRTRSRHSPYGSIRSFSMSTRRPPNARISVRSAPPAGTRPRSGCG